MLPVTASAEQAARLPPQHGTPWACTTQPSSLRAREEEQVLPKTPLGSWADRGTDPDRRVSSSLSPIFSLFLIPSGILYQKVQHLLAEDEAPEGSPPPVMKHRRPGPKHLTYGIPTSKWSIVVQRVAELKEPLRTVAAYGVSHETMRRILLLTRQWRGQQDA